MSLHEKPFLGKGGLEKFQSWNRLLGESQSRFVDLSLVERNRKLLF
jgi:hypothetical protein